jgi:hypothetical protein
MEELVDTSVRDERLEVGGRHTIRIARHRPPADTGKARRGGVSQDTSRTRLARSAVNRPGSHEKRNETFTQVTAGAPSAPQSYERVALPSELDGRDGSR